MVWIGVFLLAWFITLFGGAAVAGWTIDRLGVTGNEGFEVAVLLLVVVGSFVASLLFTLWFRRRATREPEPWPEPEPSFPGDEERDARIAARIARTTRYGTITGAAIGLVGAVAIVFFGDPKARDVRGLLMAPISMGGAGFFLGLAVACLFAPDSFLAGPVGRPYMEKIGTRSITVARLACLMVGLIIGGPLLGLTALILIVAFQ